MEGANWVMGTLDLLPLPLCPTNVVWAIVWVSWLFQGCPKQMVLLPPTPPPTPL